MMSGETLQNLFFSCLRIGIAVYLVLGIGLFIFQRQVLYFPDKQAFDVNSFGVTNAFEAIDVLVDGDVTVQSWYQPPREAQKTVIVFCHGNAGNFGLRADRILPLLAAGYGVALVSFPGFEGNTGKPTEMTIYQSARGVIKALGQRGVPSEHIILHGESLGTTVAVQMATEFLVAAVSLESPPASMVETGAYHYPIFPVKLLLWDKFDSLSKIHNVKAPLLLIHGEADTVVPVSQGKALFAAANEPKEALFVPGVGHGYGLYSQPVQDKLMAFYARYGQ
ncbi:MAG: alpha/beta hydrolase [Alphaproteobacteria bacterium]|nr:alpha/beta hydrolase [Alphaproteobacteria bacterium]